MLLRTRRGLIEFGRTKLAPQETITPLVLKIAATPGGLQYLRSALADTAPALIVQDLAPSALIREVTARIVDGTLAFVFPRHFETQAPAFVVQGEAATVIKDQKNKAGDLKPAPEIPPEYPVLARAESDKIIESTARLVAAISKQMFLSFARARRPSTIARSYVIAAKEQGQRILSARQTTDVSLEIGKWPGGGLDRPKPQVPVEYKSAAQSTGVMTKVAIDKLAASLGPQDSSKKGRPAPAVPETYVHVASGTADSTRAAISSLGSSLASAFRVEPSVRPPRGEVKIDSGE